MTWRNFQSTTMCEKSSSEKRSKNIGKICMPQLDKQFDLFLSYNAEDGEYVALLARLLKLKGLRVWFDRWQLSPGQNFVGDLKHVLRDSASIAVCVGRGKLGRRLRQEFHEALEHGLRCVAILLPLAEKLPEELAQFKAFDFRSGSDETLSAS